MQREIVLQLAAENFERLLLVAVDALYAYVQLLRDFLLLLSFHEGLGEDGPVALLQFLKGLVEHPVGFLESVDPFAGESSSRSPMRFHGFVNTSEMRSSHRLMSFTYRLAYRQNGA